MASSPRSSFWTAPRAALATLALALPALTLQFFASACANADGGSDGAGGGTGSADPVAATGAGGIDGDATVPDGQPDVTPPNYAELCGEGDCVPGDLPDDCGLDDDLTPLGCRVELEGEEPVRRCGPAGEGAEDAPCQTGADCLAGAACVPTEGSTNEGYTGVCRPYCCGEVESCPGKSFCAPRPLVGVGLTVPVCVAVAPCELLSEGACANGKACTIVRSDGTTSCVEPGTGALCEACPCGPGLICAQQTNLCQKLCHTDGPDDECGGGICQGGSPDYPAGIGVCIGAEHFCK